MNRGHAHTQYIVSLFMLTLYLIVKVKPKIVYQCRVFLRRRRTAVAVNNKPFFLFVLLVVVINKKLCLAPPSPWIMS